MKKFLIVGLVICGGLGWAWQSGAISFGSRGYRVEFTGKPGAKLIGVVGWSDLKNSEKPMRLDKAEGILPYTVDLNPPEGAIVTASGNSLDDGDVTIKIYHNGVECGKSVFEGTAAAALSAKVCKP